MPDASLSPFDPASPSPSFLEWIAGKKVPMLIGVTLAVVAAGLLTRYSRSQQVPPPEERLEIALHLLEERENPRSQRIAGRIARELEEAGYHPPGFGGGVDYILGILAFREAEELDEISREPYYRTAVDYLIRAERSALQEQYRPEWAYALGVSLYKLQSLAAQSPLEEALDSFPEGRLEIAQYLTQIYLDLQRPELLEKALKFNQSLLDAHTLSLEDENRLWMNQAELLLDLGKTKEAEVIIERIADDPINPQGKQVLLARLMIAEERYPEANDVLEPISRELGLERKHARQASYLLGISAEGLMQTDAALDYHQRTVQQFLDTPEGLAACVHAADLLRAAGRNEEALELYELALQQLKSPDEYRNRWLTRTEFQQRVLATWQVWEESHAYQETLDLSQLSGKLLGEIHSAELMARCRQKWAEHLQDVLKQSPRNDRLVQEREVLNQWRLSGKAYQELAELLTTTPRYAETLWISAEHYRRGHAFDEALSQLTLFLETHPEELLPTALVKLGEVLLDLDRIDEAQRNLKQVLELYPTSPVVYEAEYLLGVCYQELDQPDLARQTWNNLLTSKSLSPAAKEWQQALFALGRLLYYQGCQFHSEAEAATEVPIQAARHQEAYDYFRSATEMLDLYLRRYPEAEVGTEARYYLGKSLQQNAQELKALQKSTETENARKELENRRIELLKRSLSQFQQIQHKLSAPGVSLTEPLQEIIFKNALYESAHTAYALEDYSEALAAYSRATTRYPGDPQVLLAYFQMANCYEHLQRPREALSMLEQAKLLLKTLPATQPASADDAILTEEEWEQWLNWLQALTS